MLIKSKVKSLNEARLYIEQSYENSSIGILLCTIKEYVEVEIALRDVNQSIGMADHQLQFPEKEIKELISNELKKNKKLPHNTVSKK